MARAKKAPAAMPETGRPEIMVAPGAPVIPFKWIPADRIPPPRGTKILACGRPAYWTPGMETRRVIIETVTEDGKWTSDWKITHWFPIPAPPGEETSL